MDSLLPKAIDLAIRAHAGQRYGAGPYEVHLRAVDAVVVRFLGGSEHERVLRVAAWLHDVLEDTHVTRDELLAVFGAEVTGVVHAVTDEPGATRQERKHRTYPKIRSVGQLAVLLKLADRIANVESCLPDHPKLRKYRAEHPEFRTALFEASEGPHLPMWAHLDGLLAVTSGDGS